MRTVALFLLFVASSSAFTVAPPLAVAGTKQNGRFSSLWAETDSNSAAKPLEEIDIAQPTNLQAAVSSEGSVVKDMNTGEIKEVKWVDPAMTANTKCTFSCRLFVVHFLLSVTH